MTSTKPQKITDCYIAYLSIDDNQSNLNRTVYKTHDKFNVNQIPRLSYCKLTNDNLNFGQEARFDNSNPRSTKEQRLTTRLEFYNGTDKINLDEFMGKLNFLTSNGFELISYHPSNRATQYSGNETHAILRKV